MANTININIKNCCCCGGGTPGSPGTEIVPIDEWPDPTGEEGPPEGYGEPSTLEDRQCKVAVFLYYWIYYFLDQLVNTTLGVWFVNFMNSQAPNVVKVGLITIITSVLAALATPGIEITDAATAPLGGIFGTIMGAYLIEAFRTYNITLPLLEDILAKLPNIKDQIICRMAQGENYLEVYTELEKALADADLSLSQRKAFFALIPPQLINFLYWSVDWWPSFETETLASITETCCGDMEEGQPLLPGGEVTKCDAANFIIDQLIELFNNTGEFIDDYGPYWWNHILDVEGEIYENVLSDLTIPTKLKETAYDINLYQRFLAKYMAEKFITWNPLDNLVYDTTFPDLMNYLLQNNETLVCLLFDAANMTEAYTNLHDVLETWLDTNVTDADQNMYLENAIQGLIHSEGDFMNLLFTQDTDLLGYTGVIDCAVCSGGGGCANRTRYASGFQHGTINSDTGTVIEASGGYGYGVYWLTIDFNILPDLTTCGPTVTINSIVPVGFAAADPSGLRMWSTTNTGGTPIYNSDDMPGAPVASVRTMMMISQTPFTATINYAEET